MIALWPEALRRHAGSCLTPESRPPLRKMPKAYITYHGGQ
jgi:hypothetical protein